jgi:hypothetical protein
MVGAVVLLLVGGALAVFLLSGNRDSPRQRTGGLAARDAGRAGEAAGPSQGQTSPNWREIAVPFDRPVWEARVSSEALVLIGDRIAVAYLPATGAFITLSEGIPVFDATVEDSAVVLWELADGRDSELVAFALPDGPRTVLSAPGPQAIRPLLSRGHLTWVEPQEDPDPGFQRLEIYRQEVDDQGLPTGESELLIDDVIEVLEGDTYWDYASLPPYLAFEQHRQDGERRTGLHLLSPGGQTMLLDPRGYSAGSGEGTFYWDSRPEPLAHGSVRSWEVEAGAGKELVREGEWPCAGDDFLAFVRRGADTARADGYEVVAVDPAGGREEFVATIRARPLRQPLRAGGSYLVVLEDDRVRLFARGIRPEAGDALSPSSPPTTTAGAVVEMPHVLGLPPADAEHVLLGAGLRPQLDLVHGPGDEDAGEMGVIYRQTPEPGGAVERGAIVRIRAWFEAQ